MKRVLAIALCGLMLAGCQQTAPVDVSAYEPIVDLQRSRKKHSEYATDLYECRKLAFQFQVRVEREAKKEREQRLANAFLGAMVGAAVGRAVAGGNNPYRRQYVGAGALAGASGATAGSPNNYDYAYRTRGVNGIVDNCLNGRGYQTLNPHGL